MWEKIKKVLSWIGGIVVLIAGYFFLADKSQKSSDVDRAKSELEEIQKKVDEEKKKLEEALQVSKEAQKQTDEEVEHAKEVEVPSDPAAVADALNDVLDRIGGGSKSGSTGKQNCNGCAGRN
jgi:preprotein translocase subunit SecF